MPTYAGTEETTPAVGPEAANLKAKAVMIASGESHTLCLLENGEVWGWGRNVLGSVGNGTETGVSSPVKILENIESISADEFHSAAISKSKELYMWGENSNGCIGEITPTYAQSTPKVVMKGVKSCSIGSAFSAAATETGELYVWFCGGHRNGYSFTPELVAPQKIMDGVEKVSCGNGNLVVLKDNGELFMVNGTYSGMPGIATFNPKKVDLPDVVNVFAGSGTYFAIDSRGKCFMWGKACDGSIEEYPGIPELNKPQTQIISTPQLLDNDVIFADASYNHVAYVKSNGDTYIRGSNYGGKLGTGTQNDNVSSFQKVMSGVKMVQTTSDNTFVLLENGGVMGCGQSSNSQLGKIYAFKNSSVRVMEEVKEAYLGHYKSYVLKKNGELWGFGHGNDGNFEDADKRCVLTPVLLDTNVKEAAAGDFYVAVLKNNGELWYKGGFTSMPETSKPVLVDTQVEKLKCGRYHIGYIKDKSNLWMVGGNSTGQIGCPTCETVNVPFLVMKDVKDFDLSYFSSYAITLDGKLWSWGGNNAGQLGDGIGIGKTEYASPAGEPTMINYKPSCIMENIAYVNSGGINAAAIDNNGNLYTWGYNEYGQLGDGSVTDSSIPVKIANDIIKVSIGLNSTMFTDKNNQLYMCGQMSNIDIQKIKDAFNGNDDNKTRQIIYAGS